MIIDKVDICGFGRLRDRAFVFSPTLNVLFGRNEAGKSTLLEAIQALLYGQFRDSAAWSGETARARFLPWSGAPYAGTLHLRLASGDCYRIDRFFDDERTAVLRNPAATDVTAQYRPGPHGWVEFADQYLGLTPAVFRACAYIHQADLAPDRDDVKLLHARLTALAESGGTEKSAYDAMTTLDGWLAACVTLDPHGDGTSRIDRAEATVRDLRDRLKASRDALDNWARLFADEARLTAMDTRLQGEIERLDRLIAWREAEEIEGKLRRLADLERRQADRRAEIDRLTDVAAPTQSQLDEAQRALAETSRFRGEVERIAARARREEDDRRRIDGSLKEIASKLRRLPAGTHAPPTDLAAAEATVERWEGLAAQFRKATDNLTEFQASRKEAEVNRDPRLNRLPRVTVSELRRAVEAAARGQSDFQAAEQALAERTVETDEETELHALQTELFAFSADELARMRALETDLTSDATRGNGNAASPIPLATAIAAVVGLGVGYGLGLAPGAALGSVGFGAGAYGLASLVTARRGVALIPKGSVVLDHWLAEYGARSVNDLEERWERMLRLEDKLTEAHRLQERADAARRALVAAFEDLERTAGTQDLDDARQGLALLEAWTREQAALDRAEAELRDAILRAERAASEGQQVARTALERLGIASEEPTAARRSLDDLRADRDRRATLLQQQSELEAERGQHDQTVKTLAERRSQFELAEGVARERLAAVGVVGGSESWATELARRRERVVARENAAQDLDAQDQLRRVLVGSDNPDDWWPRMAERRSVGLRPDPDDARTPDELRAEATQRRTELADTRTQLTQIKTRRQERSGSFAAPAELEEELAEATATLERLQRRSTVYAEARALIETVAEEYRRNFAPRLGDSVSSLLDRATAHRYERAEVSATDLSVALVSHDRGGLVTLDHVSRGTRDAVALLYRASVVDLLSSTGEPVPLFLDDPLVNVDSERAQSILAILNDLAQSRQIFYCTHDQRVIDWIRQVGDCQVQDLEAAAGSG